MAALDAERQAELREKCRSLLPTAPFVRHGDGLGSPRPRVAAPRRLAPMAACPSCSRDVAEGFAFCPHCGAPLAPEDASQEERKLVTLLFADVTGSTRLSEELDAEVVRELMGAYFALAREEIEARGGTVEKFIGDAVMAVFGVPVAHEDDPARALRAALGIRKRLVELNRQLQADGRPELQVRIGINSGEVVSTTTPRRGEVMVTGDAVNVAARVQQLAEPGQILVGQRTVAAAPSFRYRALGPRGIRGKTVDVEVSELIGEAIGAPERGTNLLRAPLVGREEELALLTSLVDRVAADRRPHLVTLYGQPGVGKSRLTAEFLATLARRPVPPRVVRGRCLSYGSGVTFWPLAEILKSEAEILDSDPPEEAVRKLDAMRDRLISTELATDPSRTTALLGFTVGIAVPGHDFSRMDPEQLRIGVVEAWRIFFSALATGGPVIAVIEDIHWADTALLDVLDDLGARVQGSVLFLCPARPDLTDRRPGWGGGRRSFSAVFLDPLEPEDTSRLVSLLLEVADLPPDLHARIVDRTGGNPFFVEEILRQMIDEGRILRDGEGWRAEAGLTAVQIPDTVQAVLAARIDLLGPDEKRALQAAAVVGRIFWPEPVGRSLDAGPARVDELLRGLESRDLVLARLGSSMAGQPEFIFKHALVRDVAYESIPKRDRAMAHLQVARWIEETAGERRLEVVELLAHHYTAAQRAASWGHVEPDRREEIRSRAVELLFDAAEEAGRLFAVDRARERLDTGLELAKGPIERARGMEGNARLLLWQDDGDAAWQSAREAIDLRVGSAEGPVDRRAIARLCGLMLSIPTRWPGLMHHLPARDEARPYLDLGLSMLDEGDSEERLGMLMALAAWGWGFGEADLDPARNAEYAAASTRGRGARPSVGEAGPPLRSSRHGRCRRGERDGRLRCVTGLPGGAAAPHPAAGRPCRDRRHLRHRRLAAGPHRRLPARGRAADGPGGGQLRFRCPGRRPPHQVRVPRGRPVPPGGLGSVLVGVRPPRRGGRARPAARVSHDAPVRHRRLPEGGGGRPSGGRCPHRRARSVPGQPRQHRRFRRAALDRADTRTPRAVCGGTGAPGRG